MSTKEQNENDRSPTPSLLICQRNGNRNGGGSRFARAFARPLLGNSRQRGIEKALSIKALVHHQ